MNKTQIHLRTLFSGASDKLDKALCPPDVEQEMAEFLHAALDHPEEREFAANLLMAPGSPWEFVQFCIHGLRWPELREFVSASLRKDQDNPRAWGIWQELLEAFEDDWEDAAWYREYQKNVQ